jgi:hypothetical protein
METITIEAEVGQDHRLIEPLPPEVPVGRVKLVIQPLTESVVPTNQPLTREAARRRWQAAGKMLTRWLLPDDAVRSTESEDRRLSDLFGQGPSLEQLVDEDRGPHE